MTLQMFNFVANNPFIFSFLVFFRDVNISRSDGERSR